MKPSFSDEIDKGKKYYSIPEWLIKFNKIESIDFENADLDNLDLLRECPVKYLIFNSVKFSDSEKVALAIRQLSETVN